eukprot:1158749-Pelagomonas_calceolata.AAC.8
MSSVSVESNLFNSTGSEPVRALTILSTIATALYFTDFSCGRLPQPQELLLLDIPSIACHDWLTRVTREEGLSQDV